MEGNEITVLLKKDIIDYILSFAPLVLSCIAIGISIYFARQQNKNTLFEKRYKAYCFLQFVGKIAEQFSGQCLKRIEVCERMRHSEDSTVDTEQLFDNYVDQITTMLAYWANERLIYSGTVRDYERTIVLDACIKGRMNLEVHENLRAYLVEDRETLDQAALLYDKKTSKRIFSTASSYYALCEEMLMVIAGERAHVVDDYYQTLGAFLKAAQYWKTDSSEMRDLKKLIHL